MMKKILFVMILLTAIVSSAQQTVKKDSGTITVSGGAVGTVGGAFQLNNDLGMVTNGFEIIVTGTPATLSVITKGCMRGGTCDTLDTYTTVANANRKPTISVPYDYFEISATWTGGSSPTVRVNRTATLARSGGGGVGGGVTSVFGQTGVVPDLNGDVATGGSSTTTLSTVNANVGQFTKLTVNGKGLVTAATTLSAGDIPAIAESGVTNLTADLALKAPLASPVFTGTPTIPNFTNATHTHANAANGGVLALGAAIPDLSGAITTNASSATSAGKADAIEASTYCLDAGSTDAYACNLSPAITAYTTGVYYRFKANTANTGAATINFNSLGAKTIKKAAGGITTDLVDNDIRAGQWVELVYDGTNMQIQSLLGNAASGNGTPGGLDKQLQFNNAGAFGGLANWSTTTNVGGSAVANSGLFGNVTETLAGTQTATLLNLQYNPTVGSDVNDIHVLNMGGTFSIHGNAGQSMTATYSTHNYDGLDGHSVHWLEFVNRAYCMTASGATIDLCTSLYATAGTHGTNVGTLSQLTIGSFTFDAIVTSSAIPQAIGLAVSPPPVPTGGGSITNAAGITVSDITQTASAGGTAACGICDGGLNSGSTIIPLFVFASNANRTATNIAVFNGGTVQIANDLEISGDINTISSASAHTRLQLTCNGTDCGQSVYNGSVTYETFIKSNDWWLGLGNGGQQLIRIGSTNKNFQIGALATFGTASALGFFEGTAPTDIAGYSTLYPDSTAHEWMAATNGSATAGMLQRAQPGDINQTSKTAAIATATLCAASAGACNVAGVYRVHWDFWGSGTACSSVTAGSVTFLLTWTDENAITHSAVAMPMLVQTGAATTTSQSSFPFQLNLANESASGDVTISTNGSIIQYATGYTACTTGTGTYNLRVVVTRVK
jgi:hypothetical protein